MIEFTRLDSVRDRDRVADLLDRAADYVILEAGREPDAAYLDEVLTGALAYVGPEDVFNYGLQRPDGTLVGFCGALRGYYGPWEWYIGLLLIDPALRGQRLGHLAVEHIRQLAQADGGVAIRIAVLDANHAARRFWEREGFALERTLPADPDGDGHMRHILKLSLTSAGASYD